MRCSARFNDIPPILGHYKGHHAAAVPNNAGPDAQQKRAITEIWSNRTVFDDGRFGQKRRFRDFGGWLVD